MTGETIVLGGNHSTFEGVVDFGGVSPILAPTQATGGLQQLKSLRTLERRRVGV